MNGKPGTKAECDALAAARDHLAGLGLPYAKHLASLHEKLTAPFKAKPELPDPFLLQDVLVAGGGVIPVATAGAGWWSTQARRAANVGMTVADAGLVGRWLAEQPWAKNFTIDRVINGWPSYLARARKGADAEPNTGWGRPEFGD